MKCMEDEEAQSETGKSGCRKSSVHSTTPKQTKPLPRVVCATDMGTHTAQSTKHKATAVSERCRDTTSPPHNPRRGYNAADCGLTFAACFVVAASRTIELVAPLARFRGLLFRRRVGVEGVDGSALFLLVLCNNAVQLCVGLRLAVGGGAVRHSICRRRQQVGLVVRERLGCRMVQRGDGRERGSGRERTK